MQNGAVHMALDTTVPPPKIVAVAGNDLRFKRTILLDYYWIDLEISA